MKIVVTGCDGQLGKVLKFFFKKKSYFFNKQKLDISNFNNLKQKLYEINPKIVVNTAAYTDVENAEKNKKIAFLINKTSVHNLVKVCKSLNIFLIHISTDFVFNGNNFFFYKPEDKTDPINIYGASKLAGENIIKKSKINYLIIRTSWLYSDLGRNFVLSIINNLKKKKIVDVVSNEYGTPTSAYDLALCIKKIINLYSLNKINSGTYHFANQGKCSRYLFAKEIQKLAIKYRFLSKFTKINSLKYRNSKFNVKRPINTALNSNKICELINFKNTHWKKSLAKVIKKISLNSNNKI